MNRKYNIFANFIKLTKNGKRVIIVGRDYVVMSRNVYDAMTEQPNMGDIIGIDEATEMTPELYKKINETESGQHSAKKWQS